VGGQRHASLELSPKLSLKSITAYRSTGSVGVRDADNTPFVILTTDLTTDSRQFSQELQAHLKFDKASAISAATTSTRPPTSVRACRSPSRRLHR
jgi:iron complex outermembrane receptor protein